MCELFDQYERRGLARGKEEGIAEGEAKGEALFASLAQSLIDSGRELHHCTGISFRIYCNIRKAPLFGAFYFPQHFLYFLPLPQGHGSFLPILNCILL